MSIWCIIPIIIVLAACYYTIYAMCKVAGDADDRMEEFKEAMKGETK